jgi:hypothetical protein
VAAGFLGAAKMAEIPLREHRIIFYGAGSAAVGTFLFVGFAEAFFKFAILLLTRVRSCRPNLYINFVSNWRIHRRNS